MPNDPVWSALWTEHADGDSTDEATVLTAELGPFTLDLVLVSCQDGATDYVLRAVIPFGRGDDSVGKRLMDRRHDEGVTWAQWLAECREATPAQFRPPTDDFLRPEGE